MSERSKLISRLRSDLNSRAAYIKAKLGVIVPSKIRALRLKSNMPRQGDLARIAKMHQSRISLFETPGAANVTLETLARLAAAFKVGLIVDFVPFSEMLRWENNYSQDSFNVTRLDNDGEFLEPRELVGLQHAETVLYAETVLSAVGRTSPTTIDALVRGGPTITLPQQRASLPPMRVGTGRQALDVQNLSRSRSINYATGSD